MHRLVPLGALWLVTLLPAQESRPARPFPDEALQPIFDGRSLAGWVDKGGRYDGDARWSVADGAIVGRPNAKGGGGLLYTERRYGNFLLTLEAKIDHPFDSGIFLRMLPPKEPKGAQITIDHRPGGEIGAIYSDGFLQHNADGGRLLRRDAWNRFDVRCTGGARFRIEAWLNGAPLVDYTLPADARGYAAAGRIGLQVHGGGSEGEGAEVRFRDLRVAELPCFDAEAFACDARGFLTPTAAGVAAGWRALFDGRSLAGWEPIGDPGGYVVRDGLLVFPVRGPDAYLRTREDFEDFVLRLDFRLAPGANSGVFLRADRASGNPAFSGCEVQIIDDHGYEALTGHALKEWQHSGALYASVAPGVKDALLPAGQWNSLEITYQGSRLRTVLNDRVLYDVDTHAVPVLQPGARPFAERARRGFLGLQRHAPKEVQGEAYAWFRNVFVRPLRGEAGR